MRGFDDELVEKLVTIDSVKFDRNPFICDECNLASILNRQQEVWIIFSFRSIELTIFPISSQMKWKYMPVCFQPENLRGRPINRLKRDNLEFCFDTFADEGRGFAIISQNLLHESRLNFVALMGASIFVLMLLIIIVSIAICTRQRAHYYTREDGKGGEMESNMTLIASDKFTILWFHIVILIFQIFFLLTSTFSTLQNFCLIPEAANEKCLEGSLITGTEINFKFPLDDRSICTIDEICLPPPPTPPSKLIPKTSS